MILDADTRLEQAAEKRANVCLTETTAAIAGFVEEHTELLQQALGFVPRHGGTRTQTERRFAYLIAEPTMETEYPSECSDYVSRMLRLRKVVGALNVADANDERVGCQNPVYVDVRNFPALVHALERHAQVG